MAAQTAAEVELDGGQDSCPLILASLCWQPLMEARKGKHLELEGLKGAS